MEKLDNNNIESEQEEGTEKSFVFVIERWKFDLLFSRESLSIVTSPLTATEKKSSVTLPTAAVWSVFFPAQHSLIRNLPFATPARS